MVAGNRGGVQPQVLTDSVRSIITLALKAFFSDDLIRDRYAAAYTNGFGSPERLAMPTLHDLLSFCSHECLRLDSLARLLQNINLGKEKW